MISDVLSDAVAEIDRYLSESAFQDTYQGVMRGRIVVLRDRMDAMRAELDTAPTAEPADV